MAQYPINQKGIDCFEQLKKDLQEICNSIEEEGNKLRQTVKGNSAGLGFLKSDIEEYLQLIEKFEKANSVNIGVVIKLIDVRINRIEEFLIGGLG